MHLSLKQKFPYLVFGVVFLFCCKKPPETKAAAPAGEATSPLAGDWAVANGSGLGSGLNLYADSTKIVFILHQDNPQCGEASYVLKGDIVQIGATHKCSDAAATGAATLFERPAGQCTLEKSTQDPEYRTILRCTDRLFGRDDTRIKAGETVIFGGEQFVSAGWAQAHATESVKFRSRPDIAASPISFMPIDYKVPGDRLNGYQKATDTLPKDYPLLLIARTRAKQKVSNWENYWYYVQVRGQMIYQGWVFGQFVQ